MKRLKIVKCFHQKKDRRRKTLKKSVNDPKVILMFLMKKQPHRVKRREARGHLLWPSRRS